MISKDDKYKFNDLKGSNVLDYNFEARGDFSKTRFWQYTNIEALSCIIKNKTLRASRFCDLNDKNEEKRCSDPKNTFVVCFCNTRVERVSMWIIYSGLDYGVSFGINPTDIRKLLKTIHIKGVKENGSCEELSINNGDAEVLFNWAVYKDDYGVCSYRNTICELDETERKQLHVFQHFIKDYSWIYENEFRIVIRIKNKKLKGLYKNIDIDLPEKIIDRFKYRIFPSSSEDKKTDIRKALLGIGDIKDDQIEDSNIQIDIDLFKKNRIGFLYYIKELKENKKDLDYLEKIKEIIA